MLFRLFRALVFLVLILAVVAVIGFVVGRPFVERLAARSIEDRVGTPVSVSIATSVRPGVLRGDIGNVTVRAKQFEHNGLQLAGAQAVYHGVAVHLSDLISRRCATALLVRHIFGDADPERARGLRPTAARRARAAVQEAANPHGQLGQRRFSLGKQHAVMGAKIVGLSSIRFVPRSGSPTLGRALTGAIQLGPLFDGVHLTGIALHKGGATLTGAGPGGDIKA